MAAGYNTGLKVTKWINEDHKVRFWPNPVSRAPYRPPLSVPSSSDTGIPEFIILNEDEISLTEI